MLLESAPGAPAFNLFAPTFVDDPYPVYAAMLDREPYFDEATRIWVLTRYADVQPLLRSPRFSQASFAERMERSLGKGPLTDPLGRWLLFRDPPHHTRLRALVSQAFTPRAVERLRHTIQRTLDPLLSAVRPLGRMDVIADLAYPLPVRVICALLGVPAADRGDFAAWSAALADSLDALTTHDADVVRRGNAAAAGLDAYFRDLVRARRLAPGDDLLSALIAARDGADRLSEDELLIEVLLDPSPHARPSVEIDVRRELALLPYSSGTTGMPKGVELTHAALVNNLAQAEPLRIVQSDDVMLGLLPLFHAYGQFMLHTALAAGATVVLTARFELEGLLRVLQERHVTLAPVVPPIVLALARSPLVDQFDLTALHTVLSAVADVAVIPSPDAEAGEVPKACVALRADVSEADLLAFVARRVAPYKRVRRLEIVESVPKSASGKLLRRLLVERERTSHAAGVAD